MNTTVNLGTLLKIAVESKVWAVGALIILITAAYWIATKPRLPHPPGPRGYPILGYLKPVKSPTWETYYQWSQIYGSDILRLNILGTNIILANSLEVATDLLEKRSSIYSDRPAHGLTMLRELTGAGWLIAISRYSSYWRDCRKAFQQEFTPQAGMMYRPIELKAAHKLLNYLLKAPLGFRDHVRGYAGRQIIEIAYGIEVKQEDDPYMTAAERLVWITTSCMVPGRYLVDLVPILKHVPEWFPGAEFKRQAREWRKDVNRVLNDPFNAMKAREESVSDCAAKSMLEKMKDNVGDPAYRERIVKATLASMHSAGADTTTSSLDTFFLAMTLHPSILKRAQQSVDRVCYGRVPGFSDYEALPYIHAIVKECLRWRPVVPMDFAHMVTQDDIYNGYHIPAGSIVLANSWAILHDPKAYDQPEQFNPERFLKKQPGTDDLDLEIDTEVRDPMVAAFGFGRRICPGRFMAYESMWIAVATVVAIFDICPTLDSRGNPAVPSVEYTGEFLSHPKPFTCSIFPRSEDHAARVAAMTE